ATVKYRKEFLEALKEEIYIQRNYLSGKEVQSIYFGGGTPSLLNSTEILNILNEIKKYFPVSKQVEITLEANPDDIQPEMLNKYRKIGINRLSIGVQSFFPDDLEYLNRIHSAEKAKESINQAIEAGFDNLSLDLIYGIPGLTMEKWKSNLDMAFSMGIQHISAYALTVEPKTALDLLIRKDKLPAPMEEDMVLQFKEMMQEMKRNGFIHYEISNFCKEGYYSKHNSMYWSGEHYLGLGPSAHSFNGVSRQWNVASVIQYIDQIRKNERFFESETLTRVQRYNEYVMTSLRTMWGCDGRKLLQEFGAETASGFWLLASGFIEKGLIVEENEVFILTDEGKLFTDGIAAELFLEPEDSTQR
ncbi:MAG: radical SAM family heme chaperone HemW, partial [Bacteroidota bacterium]